jgi:hypothetical protein
MTFGGLLILNSDYLAFEQSLGGRLTYMNNNYKENNKKIIRK